jgi:orotidine-5'-phosphate decarboxylase
MIITKQEMRDIREGKGLDPVANKKLPAKKLSVRDKLFLDLKKADIPYKGNMSNAALKDLLEGDK